MRPDHVCVVCGHVHDEETEGKWENLPEDFQCPECGVGKEDYETPGGVTAKSRTPAKTKTADLDTVKQARSSVTAHAGGVEKEPIGTPKTLGRGRRH